MRFLKAWACAAAVAATAAPALGQLTGGTPSTSAGTGTSSTGTATRSTTGTSNLTNTGTGGITGGNAGTTGSSGNALGSNNNMQAIEAPPQISAPTGNQSGSLQQSNRFAGYYANPYHQGKTTSTATAPGGFGMALFPATSTGGAAGGRTGATGAAGFGGRNAGLNSAANQSGILVPLPVQINYAAELRFAAPPFAPTRLQADLRGIVDTGGLANAAGVQVVTDANNNVTLRGAVRDDDERRLAEGLVRLTPGVRNIVNELTYPGK